MRLKLKVEKNFKTKGFNRHGFRIPLKYLILYKIYVMLKVGVLGAGHIGKIHLKLLQQSEKYQLVGFFDPDIANGQKVAKEFNYNYYEQLDKLMDAVDVVDIVTPTLSHYNCAIKSITKGKHIFIEKPITNTGEEAEHLRLLVSENNGALLKECKTNLIFDAINKFILMDYNKLIDMKTASVEKIKEEFLWNNVIEKYIEK